MSTLNCVQGLVPSLMGIPKKEKDVIATPPWKMHCCERWTLLIMRNTRRLRTYANLIYYRLLQCHRGKKKLDLYH